MKKRKLKLLYKIMHEYMLTVKHWFLSAPNEKIVAQTVLTALAHTTPGIDEEEARRIAHWVEDTHNRFTMLSRVITGEINLRFFENEEQPKISYTPYGQQCARDRDNYSDDVKKYFG